MKKISKKDILASLFLVFCILIIATHSSSGILSKMEIKAESETENSNIVYLTFDADMTLNMKGELRTGAVKSWYNEGILNYLEQNKIPATFFVTGMFAEVYPNLIKRIGADELFSIGNHTYDHKAFEVPCYGLDPTYGDMEKDKEITKTQEIIKNLTGIIPKYVRLPGLCSSKHDKELINKLGLFPSSKGIISGDAFAKDPRRIVDEVLRQIKPGKNIVIMHFGGPNAPSTEKAIKELVPIIEKRGFIFKKL